MTTMICGGEYMGKEYEGIDAALAAWIEAQPMFFVATAPRSDEGLVNCSPRGHDTLRVLDGRRVAWLDLTGSGAETIAHLRENGRICLMLCAFDGPPRIVRLQGRGCVHELGTPAFAEFAPRFPPLPGARAVIDVTVTRIADSCGYAVPRMELVEQRDVLERWAEKRGEAGLAAYRRERNARSLDGLPAWRGDHEEMVDGGGT
jgi:hypothetical protein